MPVVFYTTDGRLFGVSGFNIHFYDPLFYIKYAFRSIKELTEIQ